MTRRRKFWNKMRSRVSRPICWVWGHDEAVLDMSFDGNITVMLTGCGRCFFHGDAGRWFSRLPKRPNTVEVER